VLLALAGTRIDMATRAFMSWFGPKGVATMTFALLVLARPGIASRERIFDIAALAVLVSIILHGVTDAAGADWIARRAESEETRADREVGHPRQRG
jgi:NhaP-type Na+/H+ or K+/H+ antiporter